MPLSEYNVRITAVMGGFLAIFAGLAAWLHHLQVERHDYFLGQAKKVYTDTYSRKGRRGRIFDRDGNLLAGAVNCIDVFVEPRKIPPKEREKVFKEIVKRFDCDEDLLRKRFSSGKVEVVVKRGVDYQRAMSLRNNKLPGVRYIDSERRIYPKGPLAAHELGMTKEGNGITGIERVANEYLTPKEGTTRYERSIGGQKHFGTAEVLQTPLDGKDVYLTMIEPIQHIVETELDELCREFTPRYAYAILADPKTGAIWALAQRPTFDPNDRKNIKPDQWRNHAIEDTYHPGSTMKAVSICAALDYGTTHLNETFYCEKGIWFYAGKPLRDAGHAYEWLKVWEIVMHSSNIGTAKICLELGKGRLYQGFRRFGFGEKTGIELPHESRGLFPRVSGWDSLSITRFPIGQGLTVTPLQMVQAYCALANRGRMMQLHLIDRIVDPRTGEVVKKTMPTMRRQAAKPSAIADMVTALKTVVSQEGTAPKAKVAGYDVAGKTGTSQKWDPVLKTYDNGKYVASFIGFVPADNPSFVLLVVADEPKKKHYGGTVCAPTFSRISAQALRYLNVIEDTAAKR